MTDRDVMLIWTDGWYESDATLPENADTAVFGWYNYDAADTFVSAPAAGAWRQQNEPMTLNVVHG